MIRTVPVLAAETGFGDPFPAELHIEEFFEFPALLFDGTYFAVNRTVLILLFGVLCAIAFVALAFPGKTVPSKFQVVAEGLVGFVRDQIAYQVIGRSEGQLFVPFLLTIFLFTFFMNIWEVIPFVNFPPSSRMGIPAMQAGIVWLVFVVVGLVHHGPRYFWDVAFPPGVPKPIYILLTPIELFSTFAVRPLTLAVRLFANMFAGHILLTIIFVTIHAFLPDTFITGGAGTLVGVAALLAAPLMIGFEIVVGLLQAYIFTILAAVYIQSSLHPH